MCLVLFLTLLPFSSYVAALPHIQDEWGLNNTQAGFIYSTYLAGYAASALLIVPLTDRLDPRRILLGAAAVSAASNLLFPLVADDVLSGALLRAPAGIGLVGVYMPGIRVVAERFSSRGRGMAVGMFVTSFYAGSSASLAATGGLMAVLDWRQAYLAMALAAFVSVPLAYIALRGHRHMATHRSSGRLELAALKDRLTRRFILAYSLHTMELYAARVWLPAFFAATLISRGIENAQAAVTAATVGGIAFAAGSIGPVMGGVISDRWGRATSASVIFALSGACSWLIGWMGGFPWPLIVALSVFYGWAIAADSAIYSTAITEVASPSRLGSTMAIQSFLGFGAGFVGPILVGGILDLSPESIQWGLGFSFIGLLSLVAIAGLMGARSPSRSAPLTDKLRGD
jgi:MFS family permease